MEYTQIFKQKLSYLKAVKKWNFFKKNSNSDFSKFSKLLEIAQSMRD